MNFIYTKNILINFLKNNFVYIILSIIFSLVIFIFYSEFQQLQLLYQRTAFDLVLLKEQVSNTQIVLDQLIAHHDALKVAHSIETENLQKSIKFWQNVSIGLTCVLVIVVASITIYYFFGNSADIPSSSVSTSSSEASTSTGFTDASSNKALVDSNELKASEIGGIDVNSNIDNLVGNSNIVKSFSYAECQTHYKFVTDHPSINDTFDEINATLDIQSINSLNIDLSDCDAQTQTDFKFITDNPAYIDMFEEMNLACAKARDYIQKRKTKSDVSSDVTGSSSYKDNTTNSINFVEKNDLGVNIQLNSNNSTLELSSNQSSNNTNVVLDDTIIDNSSSNNNGLDIEFFADLVRNSNNIDTKFSLFDIYFNFIFNIELNCFKFVDQINFLILFFVD